MFLIWETFDFFPDNRLVSGTEYWPLNEGQNKIRFLVHFLGQKLQV